jgi:hypothetical protein
MLDGIELAIGMIAMTNAQLLASIAVHPVPAPFDVLLGEVHQTVKKMREAARALGVYREFTPDGRFVGDLGEVIAKIHFGLDLHSTQTEGEDAVCQVSGKCIELKLRSKSTLVWVKKIPDFLIALYLCPFTFRWGVICNGPGEALLAGAKWNEKHQRFETNLFKLLAAQQSLPPGFSFVTSNLVAA